MKTMDKTAEFARELSELSYKYGVAISGGSEIFMMERDDYQIAYQCDQDGRLWFGLPMEGGSKDPS